MLSSVPAFTEIRKIGSELALARRAQSGARSTFREAVGGEKPLDDAPTHLQFTRDRPLPHSRSVQRQDVLIASIALVSADRLLSFHTRQASKLHLLTHQRMWQFWLNLFLWLISLLSLRTARRDVTCHRARLIIQRSSTVRIAGGHCFEGDILNLW